MQGLREWIIEYLKHRDVFQKKIKAINDKEDLIEVIFADKKQSIMVLPLIEKTEEICEFAKKEGFTSLVTLNKKPNLDRIIAIWDRISDNPGFSIYFVNPDTAEKWIIFPFTHNKITEKGSLKTGLMSLFSGIEEVQ